MYESIRLSLYARAKSRPRDFDRARERAAIARAILFVFILPSVSLKNARGYSRNGARFRLDRWIFRSNHLINL